MDRGKSTISRASSRKSAAVGHVSLESSDFGHVSSVSDVFKQAYSYAVNDPELDKLMMTPLERWENRRRQSTMLRELQAQSAFEKLIFSHNFELFGGIVVLINFAIMTIETNARANNDNDTVEMILHLNRLLLVYYTFECFSRLYVLGGSFFCGGWNLLDFSIVVTGLACEAMEFVTLHSADLAQMRILKSLRMLRLVRLLRLLVAFRELYVLIAGIARCAKTLFWSVFLVLLVLNVWAILSVEYLNELVKEIDEEGAFGGCNWCADAFSDVWTANLTWFQVISGDGWSNVGRELAVRYHWPYLFFIAAIFFISFGLLNIIVAAIVDAYIAARDDCVVSTARQLRRQQHEAWDKFQNLCSAMDSDKNGVIEIDELAAAWNDSDELQQHLTTLGVSESDMENLLMLMDENGDGTVQCHEFINEISFMKTHVQKTTLYYILKHVEQNCRSMTDMRTALDRLGEQMMQTELSQCTDETKRFPVQQSLIGQYGEHLDVKTGAATCMDHVDLGGAYPRIPLEPCVTKPKPSVLPVYTKASMQAASFTGANFGAPVTGEMQPSLSPSEQLDTRSKSRCQVPHTGCDDLELQDASTRENTMTKSQDASREHTMTKSQEPADSQVADPAARIRVTSC